MAPYPPPFASSSEDTPASPHSCQWTELSENDHAEPQAGQADTHCYDGGPQGSFLAQPSQPDYVGMEYQSMTHLQHRSNAYQSRDQTEPIGSPSVIGDLTVSALAEPPDSQIPNNGWPGDPHQEFNFVIEDHDAQPTHQAEIAAPYTYNASHQWTEATNASTRPEPWNNLEASRPAPTDVYRPMHGTPSPTSQWSSYEMSTQEGFPFFSNPSKMPAPNLHGRVDDMVMPQPSGGFDYFNDEERRGSGYTASLSPSHFSGCSYAMASNISKPYNKWEGSGPVPAPAPVQTFEDRLDRYAN
jgi:hypothetical protein